MISAMMNLLLFPVVVASFRLTLIGFDQDVPVVERKLAGVAQLFLAAAFSGLLIAVS